MVRHRILIPAFVGSIPTSPAILNTFEALKKNALGKAEIEQHYLSVFVLRSRKFS